MKKLLYYIPILVIAVLVAGTQTAYAARTDNTWQERLGTWVETVWPEGRDVLINGLNHYLNFGFDSGTNGYGLRDNGGLIEFKNDGGAWTGIGSGSGGSIGTSTPLTAGQVAVATGVNTVGSYASLLFDSTIGKLTTTYASTTQLSVSGNTYLNTGLTGFLKGTAGLVSAVSSLVPGDISLTKGNFLVGNDAGVAQATSTIFISSTGNVGIGTTGPTTKLDVVTPSASVFDGTNSATWNSVATIRNTTGGAGTNALINLYTGGANTNAVLGAVQNAGGYADFVFASYNGSFAERLRINSDGNVGIGTIAPGAKLEVTGDAIVKGSGLTTLSLGNNSSNFGTQFKLLGYANSFKNWQIDVGMTGGNFNITPSTADGGTTFTTPALSIDRLSNVGIGTTNPLSKLHIVGANTAVDSFGQLAVMTSDTFGAGIGAELALGGGYSASATTTFAGIAGRKENSTSGDFAGYLQLFTSTNGSGNAERMRITSAGNVGIGTTTPIVRLSIANNSADGLTITNTSQTANNKIFAIQNTGSTLRIAPLNDASSATADGLQIDRSGNVGIGTTSPESKLTVTGAVSASGLITSYGTGESFRAGNGGVGPVSARFLNTGNDVYFGSEGSTAGGFFTGSLAYSSVIYSNTAIQQIIGGTSRMIINTAGNVGIGTTNPGTQAEIYRLETADRTTYSDLLTISAGASTIPYTGHGGGILFRATNYYNSSGALTNSARIGSTINDNSIINSGADLFFDVAPLDDGVLARAMTIKYNGNVGIGTTSPFTMLGVAGTITANNINATSTTATSVFSGILQVVTRFIGVIGAAFTPSVEGEIGIDTTSNEIKYFSGGTVRVLSPTISSSINLGTTTLGVGTTTKSFAGFYQATTFTQFGCKAVGGGTFVSQIGDGTASSTAVVSATGLTTTFTALSSNNTYTSGEALFWAVGNVSGTVSDVTCSYARTVDAD